MPEEEIRETGETEDDLIVEKKKKEGEEEDTAKREKYTRTIMMKQGDTNLSDEYWNGYQHE